MQASQDPLTAARRALGFLDVNGTLALLERGIVVLDPHSTLVSARAVLAERTTLWPNVVLHATGEGELRIGPGTTLHPGTRIVCAGRIAIGAFTEIGAEGGFTIETEAGEAIEIGERARLLGGGSLTNANRIGRGAQILGPIRCQNCRLGDGDSHRDPEPDRRGGVLKGSGVARNLEVPQGHVIQAFGLFSEGVLRQLSYFHPKP
jgi:hypothetical protein